MSTRKLWTREEFILAFNLYLKLPFSKINSRNPEVIKLANFIGRTSNSVSIRLTNFASCDPYHQQRGVIGMKGGKKQCQPIWEEFASNRALLNSECVRIVKEMKRTNINYSNNPNKIVTEPNNKILKNVLIKITDKNLLIKLHPILSKNKVLEAVEICINFYEGEYLAMTFKDWFKIVKELYDNKVHEPEIELNIDKIKYSDNELEEFEIHIRKKIFEASNHITRLKEKPDKDLLIRHKIFLEKLEEALTRVKNKTYGICRVTGKLISKNRLLALPHITLSIEAKKSNINNKTNIF